jgi:hypothetical protein
MGHSDDMDLDGQCMGKKVKRPLSVTIVSVLIMLLGCVSLVSRLIMIAGAKPPGGTSSLFDWEMLIFLTLWFAQPVGHIIAGLFLYQMRRLGFWLCLPVVALNCFVDFQEGRAAVLILLVSLGIVLSCVLPHWKKLK